MLRKALLISAVLALLMILVAGTAMAADDAVKGKTLWEAKNCKSCHGALGEGKYAGPRAGDTRVAADWVKQARTPRANMPAFTAAQVSDQDLADMLAYMKTLTAPAAFTATTYTAAANDLPGKVLYNQKRCVACHGADPSAFLKSRFTDKARVVTAADVIKQLRTPAANMPMFSATQVTDVEAGQITDYFKAVIAATPATTTTTTTTTTAAPATTLPKTGDQLPLGQFVLAGLALIGLGIVARSVARKSA